MWGFLDRISPLADHARTLSDRVPIFSRFASKTEFLSYALLFLVKMPFPPATRPRNLCGDVTGSSQCPSPVLSVASADKKGSVNYRLKQLSKKATQYKSKLPTSHATSALRLEGKCAWITTPQPAGCTSPSTNTSRTSCLGSTSTKSISATSSSKGMSSNQGSASSTAASMSSDTRSSAVADKNSEAVSFSLSLTPEAVLLLQRRNYEKQLRAARGSTGKTTPRQKELSTKPGSQCNTPLVKISLLNDRHQYDDVEYEEVVEQSVDQSVLLKCAEWLRGVEKAAEATPLGKAVKSSQKSI